MRRRHENNPARFTTGFRARMNLEAFSRARETCVKCALMVQP